MAQYSNMKKPAFYIPFSDYLQSVGMVTYQENQLKYILDNLLTLGVDDMPLLREYAETHDIR